MRSFRAAFYGFFLLIAFSSLAQKKNLKFNHLTPADGLSQSTVASIFQDSRGFMWFGTRDGLNKYDGYKFAVYKNQHEDPNSISSSNIFDILEDTKGNLWIATWGGGLNMYDRQKDTFTSFRSNPRDPNTISNDALHCLILDGDNLWIGSHVGLNLLNLNTKKFTRFLHDPNNNTSLSDNKVESMVMDSKGNLWVGTKDGLNLFDKKSRTFKRFYHDPKDPASLSTSRIFSLFEDSKNNLWVGTYGGGLNLMMKDGTFKNYQHDINNKNSLSHNVVFRMEEDNNGNLWIGTENGGLSIFNHQKEEFTNYSTNPIDKTSLSNVSVYDVYKDSKGNMWIGTYSGGINFINIDSYKFNHYKNTSSPSSLSNNTVTGIFEDSKNNLWVATDGGGVNLFDKKTGTFQAIKHEKNKPGLSGNYLLSVNEDDEGNIWIGSYGDGITIYNKAKNAFKYLKHDPANPQSMANNHAWSLCRDSENNMWIGTFGDGLDLYDPTTNTFKHHKHNNEDPFSISENFIHTIIEDKNGNLVIGTNAGGINVFNKKTRKFKHYKPGGKNSLSNSTINCLYEDTLGNIWIGTQGGLNYWNRKNDHFTVYLSEDGLASDNIWGVLDDDKGNLWISTNNGISKFNVKNKTFINYDASDGLQSNEFNRGFCKSRSGYIYFGGINGLNEFFPDSVKNNYPFEPNLVITDFEIFNTRVPIDNAKNNSPLKVHINETEAITLSHKQSVFSFEFACLNFIDNSKKRYAYILEGFDDKWNDIGSKHSVTYTNLDPGTYTLKIKTHNNRGEWSKNVKQIVIVIKPPFWETIWFKGIIALFALSLILVVFIYRERGMKRQKTQLEDQVKVRTSELQKTNIELVEQREKVLNQNEKIEDLYKDIRDSIKAAQIIQDSILPSDKLFEKYLPQSFIINKPKDLVSGDFYWFDVKNNKLILAAIDCTGHGVSGAFMSINAHHLLNQSIYNYEVCHPSEVLFRLNEGIVKGVHQKNNKVRVLDGMDIALCIIDPEARKLEFAGACSPLYILRNKEIIVVKANKFAIGHSTKGGLNTFENHVVDILPGDVFYIFSDGYADQIGGKENEKFMYHRFRELLIRNGSLPMSKQKEALESTFMEWRGENNQLDDILIIGFKLD